MNKNAALNFRERRDYVLVQELERRWSNCHETNNQINEHNCPTSDLKSAYKHQRTKSLCVFYNSSILNYARTVAANEAKKASKKNQVAVKPKDVKILQNHEKIMELQNKWTGNGRFLVRDKATFQVILRYSHLEFKIKMLLLNRPKIKSLNSS